MRGRSFSLIAKQTIAEKGYNLNLCSSVIRKKLAASSSLRFMKLSSLDRHTSKANICYLAGYVKKTLTCGLITPDDGENIRSAIESSYKGEKKVPTTGDLPLSSECKQVLNNAAKQADQLSAPHIGTEHLLLGLLSQKSMTAELLTQRGITSEHILQALKKPPSAERPKPRRSSMPPSPGSWPDAT